MCKILRPHFHFFSRKTVLIFAAVLFLLLFSGTLKNKEPPFWGNAVVYAEEAPQNSGNSDQGAPLITYYFYENVCASCDIEGEFIAFFNEQVGDVKEQANFQLKMINTFQSRTAFMKELALDAGIPEEKQNVPLILIGGQWLSGKQAVEDGFRALFLQQYHIDEENPVETGSGAAENSRSENETSKEETSQNHVNTPFNELTAPSEGSLYLRYYHTVSCNDCEAVNILLETLAADLPDLTIERVSIADSARVPELQQLFEQFDVPEKQRQVPVLFWQNGFLSGLSDIQAHLNELAQTPDVLAYRDFMTSLLSLEENSELLPDKISSLRQIPVLLGAGFVNGLNPCGLSMLLLFVSIVFVRKKHGVALGLTYLLAKGVTYFGIALALHQLLSLLENALFQSAVRILQIAAALAMLVLAVFCMLDWLACRRQEYGKVRVQLPEKLRSFNNRMIERLKKVSESFWIYPAAAAISVIVSAGEFLCTGQIMLASLLYMAETQAKNSVFLLCIYIAAMLVPSLILVAAAGKGTRALALSETLRKKMPLIKFITALVFTAFAVITFLSL